MSFSNLLGTSPYTFLFALKASAQPLFELDQKPNSEDSSSWMSKCVTNIALPIFGWFKDGFLSLIGSKKPVAAPVVAKPPENLEINNQKTIIMKLRLATGYLDYSQEWKDNSLSAECKKNYEKMYKRCGKLLKIKETTTLNVCPQIFLFDFLSQLFVV